MAEVSEDAKKTMMQDLRTAIATAQRDAASTLTSAIATAQRDAASTLTSKIAALTKSQTDALNAAEDSASRRLRKSGKTALQDVEDSKKRLNDSIQGHERQALDAITDQSG